MPFTPFHLGPAFGIKAVADEHFSLLTFGLAQIAMDIEPLVRLLRGDAVLHGFTHTYAGAALIGAVVAVFGRPVALHLLGPWRRAAMSEGVGWLAGPRTLGWEPAVAGAFAGTFSHVALDSIMHADVRPFAPLSASNGFFGIVPVGSLHLLCVAAGVLGAAGLIGRRYAVRGRTNYRVRRRRA